MLRVRLAGAFGLFLETRSRDPAAAVAPRAGADRVPRRAPRPARARGAGRALLARRARRERPREPAGGAQRAAPRTRAGGRGAGRDARHGGAGRRAGRPARVLRAAGRRPGRGGGASVCATGSCSPAWTTSGRTSCAAATRHARAAAALGPLLSRRRPAERLAARRRWRSPAAGLIAGRACSWAGRRSWRASTAPGAQASRRARRLVLVPASRAWGRPGWRCASPTARRAATARPRCSAAARRIRWPRSSRSPRCSGRSAPRPRPGARRATSSSTACSATRRGAPGRRPRRPPPAVRRRRRRPHRARRAPAAGADPRRPPVGRPPDAPAPARFMLRGARTGPLLVVGTYRDTDVGRGSRSPPSSPDLRRDGGAERIRLRGAGPRRGRRAGGRMARRRGGRAPRRDVHARTGGNAFFVEEVLRGLAEDDAGVPESVRHAVGARLARLSPEADALLAVVAVLGLAVDATVLAAVRTAAARGRAAARRALDARLLRAGAGARVEFTHALVREAVARRPQPAAPPACTARRPTALIAIDEEPSWRRSPTTSPRRPTRAPPRTCAGPASTRWRCSPTRTAAELYARRWRRSRGEGAARSCSPAATPCCAPGSPRPRAPCFDDAAARRPRGRRC